MRNGVIGFLVAVMLGLWVAGFFYPHNKSAPTHQGPARIETLKKAEFGRFVFRRVAVDDTTSANPLGQTPPKCTLWFEVNGTMMVFSPESCTGVFAELFAILRHASAGDSFLCSYYGQYERVYADGRMYERLIMVEPTDCKPEIIRRSRARSVEWPSVGMAPASF